MPMHDAAHATAAQLNMTPGAAGFMCIVRVDAWLVCNRINYVMKVYVLRAHYHRYYTWYARARCPHFVAAK